MPDRDIWQFAMENGFAIVTKDKDFYYLSATLGSPPKVVWLTVGNCKNSVIAELLIAKHNLIKTFLNSTKDLLLLD